MDILEISVLTNTYGSELVADILYGFGSSGVAIYDSRDIEELIKSDIIWDYIDEDLLKKNETVTVKGYYDISNSSVVVSGLADALNRLGKNSGEPVGSLEFKSKVVDDCDWVNVWRSYYKPIREGRIVIVPRWIKYEKGADEAVVYIDPGMAFGTGEHETTRICLNMLGELPLDGKTVMDIGTGSGILGLAAAALGVGHVYMSDIDPIAVKSAEDNARCNDFNALTIVCADLIADTDLVADIVTANITADILIRLAEELIEHVNKGGYAIISGIIHKRKAEVLEAFESSGFRHVRTDNRGEWCGILFRKP